MVYEIWSLGHKPFEEYSKHEVIRKVDSGFRLPPPPGCPRNIYHIMIQCWLVIIISSRNGFISNYDFGKKMIIHRPILHYRLNN